MIPRLHRVVTSDLGLIEAVSVLALLGLIASVPWIASTARVTR